MATNRMLTVKNRSASRVIYNIPEDHIRRVFAPGEVKTISYEELGKLSFQPGGRELLVQYLQVTDDRALQSVGIKPQPEYFMSEQQIVELLEKGTYEAFLDCLDFSPKAIIDLVKKYALSLPLNDYRKRQALKAKTGFDVDQALAAAAQIKAEEEEAKAAAARKDAAPAEEISNPAAPVTQGRRTAPNYKIISE